MEVVRHLLGAAPMLIQLYWWLATISVVAALLPVRIPSSWKNAVWASASRGKLWAHRPRVLGSLNDMSVPQAWFSHFYAIGSAANALVLVTFAIATASLKDSRPALLQRHESFLALALFQFHLMRRFAETVLMMRYPKDAKMHIIAYIFGLSYYIMVPLSLVPTQTFSDSRVLQLLSEQQGCLIFCNSNMVQFMSHATLARLSSHHDSSREEKDFYKIPRGGLFEYVSCPHYLAEIGIYMGLALLLRGRVNALLMVAWVTVNLVLAANATHRWYHMKFRDYPKQRGALIPGVH